MLALQMHRSPLRYAAGRMSSGRLPARILAPLRLVGVPSPTPPAPGWARVRPVLAGICGSDVATLSGRASLYLAGLVSFPFVPGHEVVGRLADDVGDLRVGRRVVVDPPLTCTARAVEPPCRACAGGRPHLCERVGAGHLAPGLQTGFCSDTGGGWSGCLVAHASQLHPVPDDVGDDVAVLAEPFACALHAVERAQIPADATVVVVGAGTIGLLTVAAAARSARPQRLIAVARHPHQAAFARRLGATQVVPGSGALEAVRRATRAFIVRPERSEPYLLGGADVVFDCGGSQDSLELALRLVRGGGRVVLAAMPGGRVDLTPAWFREIEVTGAYSTGGCIPAALELGAELGIGDLVAPPLRLEDWEQAVSLASAAGRNGMVKVVFGMRGSET